MKTEQNLVSQIEAWAERSRCAAATPMPERLAVAVRVHKAARVLRSHRRWVRTALWSSVLCVVLLGAVLIGVYFAQRGVTQPAPRHRPVPVIAVNGGGLRTSSNGLYTSVDPSSDPPALDANSLVVLSRLNRGVGVERLVLPDLSARASASSETEPMLRAGMGVFGGR